ncbi:MAG: ATP-dependent Clp protease adaptor ClpS [Ignavibacteriaceae bacterium]
MEKEEQLIPAIPEIEKSTDEDIDEDINIGLVSRVVLYNDDWHTFDEVIIQLIKAINCTFEQARAFAFEVHVKGISIVFNGSLNNCLKVSSVLEEIALNTQIIT